MPAISFSAKEILPALLEHTKIQTIRPGKPRMKSGDLVTFYWKQRGPNMEFCSKCFEGDPVTMFPNDGCMNCGAPLSAAFNKLLGKGRLTKVFMIEMDRENVFLFQNKIPIVDIDYLAKQDGFKDAASFRQYFIEHYYPLDVLTPFTVYRWEWK